MRNSISHNNFIIYKNPEFVFEDVNHGIADIGNTDVIYKYTFDSKIFKLIQKWTSFLLNTELRLTKESKVWLMINKFSLRAVQENWVQ